MIKNLDEFYVQWHITEKCNLRCPHCYQELNNPYSEATFTDLQKIADQIIIALKDRKSVV